ncbi:hypothetical protein, partial [Heyndrickxia sporothermodurans]
MFIISFANVDKKILRAIKSIKTKNGHSLYNADKILKNIHEIIQGTTKLTIIVSDIENEIDYAFEDIVINANASRPVLMEILGNDIAASGHEESQKIINELEKQYQLEKENENQNNNQGNSKNQKEKKKGLNILGRFKKESNSKNETNVTSEFDDLEENEEITAPDPEEFIETNEDLSHEFLTMDEENTHNDFNTDEDYNIPFEEETISESYEDFTTDVEEEPKGSPIQMDSVEGNENIIIEESYEEDLAITNMSQDNNNKNNVEKKNEKVIFPAYDSYLDLSQVNSTINRNKERFDKEHLIKFLGLSTFAVDTKNGLDLNSVMMDYAVNMLDETKFVLLRDYLHNSIETIKDKTETNLAQAYEQAMLLDYEEEATKKLEEDIEKIYSESDSIFEQYKEEQEEEYKLKLEKFEHEQAKALEDFMKQQSLEKSIVVKDLDEKKSARIGLYKENIQLELSKKKEKLLDEKMYELKYLSINQLIEVKRQNIRRFEDELDNVMDDSWGKMQSALNSLRKDIEANIPSWKQELEEKRKLAAEEREERRKQEELELQRQRIELQRQQLEQLGKQGHTIPLS